MEILFILDYFTPSKGGVERLFENIIFNLDPKKYKIKVLTSRFSKNLDKYEKIGNIEIYRVGKSRFWFTFFGIFKGLKLLKNIETIHTSTYNSAYISFILKLFTKANIVITSHEILGNNWYKFKGFKGFFYKKIEDWIYKFGFYYVFVTNHVKNVAITKYKIKLKKTKTIYNGVEKIQINKKIDRNKLGFKNEDIIGMFAGRPGRTKGINIIINNFEKIQKINSNFKLILIILEKNNTDKIQKISNKIGNNKNIKVFYEIEHNKIYEYMNIANIGIVPSITEGFGFTALEFSILGKTNVLSYIGGIPEINFGDCHFFKTENEFVKCFKDIFEGKKNNYGYKKNFSIKKMLEDYEKVYNIGKYQKF